MGVRPYGTLADDLTEKGIRFTAVGDAVRGGTIGNATQSAFRAAMRKMNKNLYEKVSQVGWSEKDSAFEVFFKDAGFRVMFQESNWDNDLFTLYDALGMGFRKDLLCASEVDMRFHGFAYIKNFDKRCING